MRPDVRRHSDSAVGAMGVLAGGQLINGSHRANRIVTTTGFVRQLLNPLVIAGRIRTIHVEFERR